MAGTEKGGLIGALRLIVLLSGAALAAMVQLAILPSLTRMAAYFSGQSTGAFDSATIAQTVMTIAAPTMALGGPLASWLIGRSSKRTILLGSLLLYAFAGAAGAVAPGLWTMFATRLLLGFAAAGFGTATIAFIGSDYEGTRRDKLLGLYVFFGSAGALVELAVAGWLASIDWRVPFSLYFVSLALFALAFVCMRESKQQVAADEAAHGGSLRPAYGPFVLIFVLSMMIYMISVQGPFLLSDSGLTDPKIHALIVNCSTVGSMITAFTFAWFRTRLGLLTLLVVIWAAFGISTLGFGIAGNLMGFVPMAFLGGIAAGFVTPLVQSAIVNTVSAEARTQALGISFGLIFLAQFVQPLILQPVRSALGIHETFVWVGAIALAAGLLTMLWGMRPARRAPAA
jgi:MFS family permease